MGAISTWSTTASVNGTSGSAPDWAPEGWAPSEVNAWGREVMASVRTWYEDAEWRNWGHTITFSSGTVFTVSSVDVTAIYVAGRRIRMVGSSTGTIYGRVVSSTFSTDTTVTASWDGSEDAMVSETLTASIALITHPRALPALPRENLLDNADFTIWQRGTSLAAIATGEHAADRWRWAQVGTGVVTISQETTVLPNEKTAYAIKIDVTTADTLIAAGDFYTITQRVEGPRAAAAGFGDADARPLTLSFWVRSPDTGAHDLAIRNSALDRAYVTTYTIAVADTWEFKVITIPGDTTGTWLKTSGAVGLHISFPLGVGLTYHGTTGTWEAANDLGVSGSATVIDDAASNFYLAEPKVEIGESATDYVPEHPSVTQERCQRYYWRDLGGGLAASVGQTTSFDFSVQFPTAMNANPTVALVDTSPTVSAGGGNHTAAGATVVTSTPNIYGTFIRVDGFSGLTVGQAGASNQAGAIFSFDADL